MPSHRGARRRARTGVSARARALFSLGVVILLALGMSGRGTLAFWTDEATVSSGGFTSGTLDITVNGALAGSGGSTTVSAFALADMVPGESKSVSFPVANNGSVGLTYVVSGTATGALAPGMRFSVYAGPSAAAGSSGSAANGNRAGTCTGTLVGGPQTLTGTRSTIVGSARSLAAGPAGTENICVIARLDPDADNTLQGTSMTASLVFDAKQVGA